MPTASVSESANAFRGNIESGSASGGGGDALSWETGMGSTATSANMHYIGGGEAFLEVTPASSGYSFIDQAMRRLDHPDEPEACYGRYARPLQFINGGSTYFLSSVVRSRNTASLRSWRCPRPRPRTATPTKSVVRTYEARF